MKVFSSLFLIVFSCLFIQVNAEESISLVVNIISHSLDNGAGKQVDVAILKKELEKFGHRVNLCDYYHVSRIPSADINLFLAQFKSEWFSQAKLNWFVPNAEFCDASLKELQRFDLILCKTEECLRIFQQITKKTYYLGFTSLNRYRSDIGKDFSKFLHVAGKSRMKGTNQVLRTWIDHPGFPELIVIRHKINIANRSVIPRNINLITARIPTSHLIAMQNECGIHVCPSKTEGFGHYIMEAMSTAAVIITTDAPPMNEFIKDKRCLVKYNLSGEENYATTYTIDEKDLANTVKVLQKLSHRELEEIGKSNREEYVKRTAEFKSRFKQLINKTVYELYGIAN